MVATLILALALSWPRYSAHQTDVVLTVPVGTTVTLETGQLLADLSFHGQTVMLARCVSERQGQGLGCSS